MKRILIIALTLLLVTVSYAQQKDGTEQPLPKVYDESIDAMSQIDEAIARARKEHKYVLCQVGGNWCPWCLRFADFATKDSVVSQIIANNFIYIHVNTSKNNRNIEAMQRLENPGRFGYPVFVILDADGRRLHTQNSSYLEEGKGYNQRKVAGFLNNWTEEAIRNIK